MIGLGPLARGVIDRLPARLRPSRSALLYGPVQLGVYAVEYAVFMGLAGAGAHLAVANPVSKVTGLILSYFAHAVFTFGQRLGDRTPTRAARFFGVFLANTALSTLVLLGLRVVMPVAVAKVAADVCLAAFTYLALRRFVFAAPPDPPAS